jgi:hypothetical protein
MKQAHTGLQRLLTKVAIHLQLKNKTVSIKDTTRKRHDTLREKWHAFRTLLKAIRQ